MGLLLLRLLGDERGLVGGEPSADGAGLLGSEVEGLVPAAVLGGAEDTRWVGDALLALVEETELRPLVGVDDGQDAGNGLADIMDAGELGRATGDLASPELDELAACCQQCVLVLVHDGFSGLRTT